MEWWRCCPALGQMMEKVTSESLCAFSSGFLLPPQPQQHPDSECVTADASLAPVNSAVALLREPSQAWFIIPAHGIDTAHSCLDAISRDASLSPPPTSGYQPHPHSHDPSPKAGHMTWKSSGTWGFQPRSHFLESVRWPNSTSSLDSSLLPSLCRFSVIWAAGMIQSKAVQLASQDHSVFSSFETESSRSEDRQRASYWVRHAFLINHIWLPWWASY